MYGLSPRRQNASIFCAAICFQISLNFVDEIQEPSPIIEKSFSPASFGVWVLNSAQGRVAARRCRKTRHGNHAREGDPLNSNLVQRSFSDFAWALKVAATLPIVKSVNFNLTSPLRGGRMKQNRLLSSMCPIAQKYYWANRTIITVGKHTIRNCACSS